MILVSLGTVVLADAALIVGIVFIVTLKQALKQKVTRGDLLMVVFAILLYVLSGIVAVLPDMYSTFSLLSTHALAVSMYLLVATCSFGSMFLFCAGMGMTAFAVSWMMKRTEISEGNKTK